MNKMNKVLKNPGVIIGNQDPLAQAINAINTRLAHLEELVAQISINQGNGSASVNCPELKPQRTPRTEKGKKKTVARSSKSEETEYSAPSTAHSGKMTQTRKLSKGQDEETHSKTKV